MRPLAWVGRAREDLLRFPDAVVRDVGYALYLAQLGEKHPGAKPLSGFGGAGVLEIVEDHHGETYRVVYTVLFAEIVYVLHAFHKKSRRGIATPPRDLAMVRARLGRAEEEYAAWRAASR